VHPKPSIRKESTKDFPGIREVVHAAFGRAGEADLVDGLRRSGVLTFSAVAAISSRIVGHVAFSPVTLDGRHTALALAPVAVTPDLQRQGIGSAFITRWKPGTFMKQKYEYKFVRLGEGLLSARSEARTDYQEQVRQQARDGWRLVQIFAPGVGVYGAAKYYELILEREISQSVL